MSTVLVDSNVLIDVLTRDRQWYSWSAGMLQNATRNARLVINPIIYGEVSVHFTRIEDLDEALSEDSFGREAIPFDAAFLAGKCFLGDRRRGGAKRSILPDFLIGAHACIAGYRLLTRDTARYRTYFPTLELIAPG